MAHPFFDAFRYPFERTEAIAFHDALSRAIDHPGKITLMYVKCGENLPPLTPGQPANLMWGEVLKNLAASGTLKILIDQVQQEFPHSAPMQKVISDVVNAQPTLAHPFFNATKYPWHRPEAAALHDILYKAIQHPNQIALMYDKCRENLPPLKLNQPCTLIWQEALQNLTAASALKKLIDQLQESFPHNTHIQKVVLDVVNAQPASTPTPVQADHVDRRSLRTAIIQAFSRVELEELCVEIEDELRQNGINEAVNLEIVGGDGKAAIVLNLIKYLERRKLLLYLVKAVRSARPGIDLAS